VDRLQERRQPEGYLVRVIESADSSVTGAAWLAEAVLYEIYPQSFADSNGDGVGDLRGVIQRLDYIESLGIDAIWFNPCFASPFVDAGYDVSDLQRVPQKW